MSSRRLRLIVIAVLVALVGSWLVAAPAQAAGTGTVTGKVLSKLVGGSATPYAGANIVFDKLNPDGWSHTNGAAHATTDGAGQFTVDMPNGTYQVRIYPVTHGNPGDLGYEYYKNKWSPYGATDVIVADGTVALDDVVLEQPGWVTGTVRDEAGNPIPNTTIGVQDSPTAGGYGVETDAQGKYTTQENDPDLWTNNTIPGSYIVEAYSSSYDLDDPVYQTTQHSVQVSANSGVVQDFVLVRRKTAVFTVQDTNGTPLANAPISILVQHTPGGAFEPIQSGPHETDADGRYRFVDTRPVKIKVHPPVGYTGTGVAEVWDGPTGAGAQAWRDAVALDWPTSAPMNRNFTVRLGAAPAITAGIPSISGTMQVGKTLTLTPGTWGPGAVDLDIEWFANGVVIPGQTEPELTLTSDLLDASFIRARVTGTKAGQAAVDADSNYLNGPVVAGDAPVTFSRPTVNGTAKVGSTLTAASGTWGPSGVGLAYSWRANGTAIAGATGSTYQPVAGDVGKQITVTVTGSLTGYSTVSRTSQPTAVVLAQIAPGTPTISGTAKAGNTLTASPGTWSPSGLAMTYQWLADGAPISGATATTLTVTNAYAGKKVTVRVTGTRDAESVNAISTPTAPVVGVLTSTTPTISGTAKLGETLTANPGAWGPAGVAFVYEWNVNGTAIAGATGSTYQPVAGDLGNQITVKVTGSLINYSTATVTSLPTAPVAPLDPIVAGTPTINGTAKAGNTLTAAAGLWTPADVTLAYQWLANGTPIAGATGTTFKLTNTWAGQKITVRVTGTRDAESVDATSAPTAAVVGVLTSAKPKISGTAKVGKALKVKPGTWGPSTVTLSYQWFRNGKAIKGATGKKLKLTRKDAGTRITIKVTGKKSGYLSASKTSAKTGKVKK